MSASKSKTAMEKKLTASLDSRIDAQAPAQSFLLAQRRTLEMIAVFYARASS
jgi:hypothetical protein